MTHDPNLPTASLPRYQRPVESASQDEGRPDGIISYSDAVAALESSSLTEGSRNLLLGLLRTGRVRIFPGGGVGIEYGSLLKTAVHPADVGGHLHDVAAHLQAKQVDLLLVPGMSGYPVGAMYAATAGIPGILLKKQRPLSDGEASYPAGSFVIPSYTGEGEVVMSADLDAVRDIVDQIIARNVVTASGTTDIVIRCAGADDIIDKATMARAVTDCAPAVCAAAIAAARRHHPGVTIRTEVVAWVTPLIKTYNRPREILESQYEITPFAGISVTGLYPSQQAIGIEGAGVFGFRDRRE